jgi:hypothetical protein
MSQAGQGHHLYFMKKWLRTSNSQARFGQGSFTNTLAPYRIHFSQPPVFPPPAAAQTRKVRDRQKGRLGFLVQAKQGHGLRPPSPSLPLASLLKVQQEGEAFQLKKEEGAGPLLTSPLPCPVSGSNY